MNFRIHMLLDAWNLYIYICLVVVIIVICLLCIFSCVYVVTADVTS